MGTFLVHFPNFGGKKIFPENPALSQTTAYGFLAPCQHLQKTDDTISRICADRMGGRTKGQNDGQTLFYRTLPATDRGPKTLLPPRHNM